MKTAILNLPTLIASAVLSALQEKNLACKYLGVDQNKRILMQVSYTENDQAVIMEQLKEIEAIEKVIDQIGLLLKAAQEQANDKIAELKTKRPYSFSKFAPKTEKIQTNGNEQ